MAEAKENHEELVKVFDTDEESEALVVRGLLESAGIDAMIQNREAPQDILPGVGGVVPPGRCRLVAVPAGRRLSR